MRGTPPDPPFDQSGSALRARGARTLPTLPNHATKLEQRQRLEQALGPKILGCSLSQTEQVPTVSTATWPANAIHRKSSSQMFHIRPTLKSKAVEETHPPP